MIRNNIMKFLNKMNPYLDEFSRFPSGIVIVGMLYFFWIIIAYYIGYYIFNFPYNGVYGSETDFLPLIRISILVLILTYPFFGFFTFIGFNYELIEHKTSLDNKRYLKMLSSFIIWSLVWPGLYFVLGYFLKILDPIFDASLPISSYWTGFWLVFILFGRILDLIPIMKAEKLFFNENSGNLRRNNILKVSIHLFGVNFGIILLAICSQFIAFVGGVFVIIPIKIAEPIPIVNDIVFTFFSLIFIIVWPVLMGFGYLAVLYFRGMIFRQLLFKEILNGIEY